MADGFTNVGVFETGGFLNYFLLLFNFTSHKYHGIGHHATAGLALPPFSSCVGKKYQPWHHSVLII